MSPGLINACGPSNLTTFEHDGESRQYLVHSPENGTSDSRPFLLNLYGYGGPSNAQMEWADMSDLADSNNFLLVDPQFRVLNCT